MLVRIIATVYSKYRVCVISHVGQILLFTLMNIEDEFPSLS